MTATDELRRLLDERGVEWSATVGANGTIWTHWDAFNGQRIHAMDNEDGTVEIFDQWNLTPAQAIAATLGVREQPSYDELIEVLRRDWDIEASWDGLRRFWYIGLTDDGVRKRDEREATLVRVMLTTDDVRDLIERHSDASGGNGRDFHNGAYVAIADELNATLGSCNCSNIERTGTCQTDETDTIKCWVKCKDEPSTEHVELIHVMECSACGGTYEYVNGSYEYCPRCGRKVVDE